MKSLIVTILIVIAFFVIFDSYESKDNSFTVKYSNNIKKMEIKTLSVLNR